MLGPPGAGKGTQAALLAKAIGIPHVSTGEMLRANVADETELGKQAEEIMAKGDLVPDELVTAMLLERLKESDAVCGYLLDGYPRNPAQAGALEAALGADCIELAIAIEVPEEELISRLLGRSEEQGRADDSEETIKNRLDVYSSETAPLIDYYEGRSALVSVDGHGAVDEVFTRVAKALAE